jgi:ABC-type transport system involved in cytochrome bd biosynthesis fused ATPase/permease subunit
VILTGISVGAIYLTSKLTKGRSGISQPLLHVAIRKRLESDKSGSFTLDVAFDAAGGITILFGQSGSGKTTTLGPSPNHYSDSGRISIGEEVSTPLGARTCRFKSDASDMSFRIMRCSLT